MIVVPADAPTRLTRNCSGVSKIASFVIGTITCAVAWAAAKFTTVTTDV